MDGWESQTRDFTTISGVSKDSHSFIFLITTEASQASQQQENISDCGIYMIYNADCLASNRDTDLEEQIDGIQLRYRYLERLLKLERQGRSERQIVDMVLPPDQSLRIKRRRIPDISEPGQNQQGSKKSRGVGGKPPSHLGPQDLWIEER